MGLRPQDITNQNTDPLYDAQGTHSDQPSSPENNQSRRHLVMLPDQPETQPPQWYQAEEGQGGQGGPAGYTKGQGRGLSRQQQQLS